MRSQNYLEPGRLRVRFEDNKDDNMSFESRHEGSSQHQSASRFSSHHEIVSPVPNEGDGSIARQSPIPKVISVLELYKSYLELVVTIGVTILMLYLHITFSVSGPGGTPITLFVDLSIFPWLIWIAKKIIDIAKAYNSRIAECESKYNEKIKELTEKENDLKTQLRHEGESFEVNHQSVD